MWYNCFQKDVLWQAQYCRVEGRHLSPRNERHSTAHCHPWRQMSALFYGPVSPETWSNENMNIPAPTYTQMPNVFLDEYARQMTEAELRIALVIMRNTFGWHRESHRMSLSYLQTATGMSRQGVINGIEGLTEKNIAGRRPSGNSYEYFLIVNEVDQNERSSQRSRPVASQRSRPNKESKKESISATQVSDDDKDQRKQFPGELMLVLHGVNKDGWKTVNKQTWQQVHSHSKRMWDNGMRASDLHRYMAWRKQNESWKTSRPRPSEIETWFASEDNPANVPVKEQIVEVWEWT